MLNVIIAIPSATPIPDNTMVAVDAEAVEFSRQVLDFYSFEQRQEALSKFVEGYPKDMFSIFYLKHEELINDI